MENPSLNLSLLCLAPKYLDLILWALSFGLYWRVDVHDNWTEVRMVSDFDIKFMSLSKLNRG